MFNNIKLVLHYKLLKIKICCVCIHTYTQTHIFIYIYSQFRLLIYFFIHFKAAIILTNTYIKINFIPLKKKGIHCICFFFFFFFVAFHYLSVFNFCRQGNQKSKPKIEINQMDFIAISFYGLGLRCCTCIFSPKKYIFPFPFRFWLHKICQQTVDMSAFLTERIRSETRCTYENSHLHQQLPHHLLKCSAFVCNHQSISKFGKQ